MNNLSETISGHRTDFEAFESRIIASNNIDSSDLSDPELENNLVDWLNRDFRPKDNSPLIVGAGNTTYTNSEFAPSGVDVLTADIGAMIYNGEKWTAGISWNTSTLTDEQFVINNRLFRYEIQYDNVIVGGGPAGIMTAYNLSVNNPDKSILLLEKNEYTLDEYVNASDTGYDDIFKWSHIQGTGAQNDPRFQYAFTSQDGKSVWMGKGLGGGTLHFGLQYIDSDQLVDHNFSEWKDDDGENIIDAVNNITGAERYTYAETSGENTPNDKYYELKSYIDSVSTSNNISVYNNKIYSNDITQGKRLLLGDLVKDRSNITIKYDTTIKKIHYSNTEKTDVDSIEDFNNKRYYGSKFILCAGAIQTPALLQRSGVDCGNKLYDHGGILGVLYSKFEGVTTTTTTITNDDAPNFVLNTENIVKINTHSSRIIRIAAQTQNGDDNKVYDFTEWANQHGGGYSNIYNHSGDYILAVPHGADRWTGRSANYRTYIGTLDETINYNNLPANLKSTIYMHHYFQMKK